MKRKDRKDAPPGITDDEWLGFKLSKTLSGGREAKVPYRDHADWKQKDFEQCQEENPLQSSKDGKLDRLVPYEPVPALDELFAEQDALWLLNVKPPWATALAHGVKDVENRCWGDAKVFKGSRWTLVVASGQRTTRYATESRQDMNSRLNHSGQGAWIGKVPVDTYQQIVGLVKFRALDLKQFTSEEGRSSVWYNGELALHVTAAFAFPTPIAYNQGNLSMTRFSKACERAPNLKESVRYQLQLLTAGKTDS